MEDVAQAVKKFLFAPLARIVAGYFDDWQMRSEFNKLCD